MKTEKILIVDDEPVVCESIKKILSRKGFTAVDTALNANEALEKIQFKNYDAVITDIMMPELDGIDFLKYIKDHYPEIDVVMITGYPSIESSVRAIKLGAFDYLVKPFTAQELYGVVLKLKDYRESIVVDIKDDNVDVDMPFNKQELESMTSKEFVKKTTPSDLQRNAKQLEYCSLGDRLCKLLTNTGIICEGECPIVRKQKEKEMRVSAK